MKPLQSENQNRARKFFLRRQNSEVTIGRRAPMSGSFFIPLLKSNKVQELALILMIGSLLLNIDLPIKKPVVYNLRKNILLSDNFDNKSIRLSYTITITDKVTHIRSQNLVLERGQLVDQAERLAFCLYFQKVHLCTDNNYPVIWNSDGTIEVREASGNTDHWVSIEKVQPIQQASMRAFCSPVYPECW